MKRIIILVVVVSLVALAITQYLRYKKFNVPNNYDYTVAENIDVNYHNASMLADYYTTAYQIGSLAREMWFNHSIDVKLTDKGDTQSINASLAYNQLWAKAKQIEGKLKEAKRLKDVGLSNEEIKYIEENGISEKNYYVHKLLSGKVLKDGDVSEGVWELQKLLNKAGFEIPIDGKFSKITETAIMDFQKSQNEYPSGIADTKTVRLLIK
jgi:Putative peptidoglycan binding domain